MTGVVDPLDIDQAATEIAVITTVLAQSPDTPLARWFEYRAYQELVQSLRNADELPEGYSPVVPDAQSLHNWLLNGTGLKRRFSTELADLIAKLLAAGGGTIDNICRVYCALRSQTTINALALMTFAMKVPLITAAIVAAGGSLLFVGGMPFTMVLGPLLGMGLLDKVCDCAAVPPRARRPTRER